ncbi:MAG: endonuclease MutS2, partial [Lachnospiraceae bacterium]|nr:endonuclease MutS2 [Lachnospiraceae bacterium]
MNRKVLQTLEYHKIIAQLILKADSDPGRKMCEALLPETDLSEIRTAQTETADALSRLFRYGSTSFGGNKDLGFSLKSLEVGSSLSIPELLKIAGFLENVARIKAYGRNEKDESVQDSLSQFFDDLTPLSSISGEIRRCLLSEEEVADDASPELKRIRRSIQLTGEKIHNQLGSMLNGSCRTYLQDAVITMRGDRYCLPIKAEFKNQVSGLVHDQSATGSTFFIEPAAVVELNNHLRELAIEEQKEIERILADLSAQISEHTDTLSANQHIMTRLDFAFAKGKLAMEHNGTMPVFNTEHYINIRKGRHP